MFTLKTDLTVDEVMIPNEQLAVVDDNAIFKNVISDIQDSGFGIACIVDDELSLLGVVTDGDIRRIILKHQRPFSSLLLESSIRFATKDPIKLDSGTNIMEALKILQDNPKTTAVAIAKALKLTFDKIVDYLLELTSDGLISSQKSEITLTDLGEKISKNINIPKAEIRYEYRLREDAPELKKDPITGETIGESRTFCKDMLSIDKYWTRDEIDKINNDMKADGFSNADNVWLARGGWYQPITKEGEEPRAALPYCRHEWNQVIVRKK